MNPCPGSTRSPLRMRFFCASRCSLDAFDQSIALVVLVAVWVFAVSLGRARLAWSVADTRAS